MSVYSCYRAELRKWFESIGVGVVENLDEISHRDFDLAHVFDLARAHASGLDRAYALARGIPRDADLDLAGVFGLTWKGDA